jgi:ADP-heptose:LPS heptosyltransferase
VSERVLIYRRGSLGDTVVTLPVFHMLADRFAAAERRVLTNLPVNPDAAALSTVLGESGLVHGFFHYPRKLRRPADMAALRRDIAAWRPDLLVYLNEPPPFHALLRDMAFFRLCGIRNIVGAPFSRALRRHRGPDGNGLWEAESARLARCVESLGEVGLTEAENWNLHFQPGETAAAAALLDGWAGRERYIAFSIGAKIDFKSWGTAPWRRVLTLLSEAHPDLGLAMVGAESDAADSDRIAESWAGPTLNLCGRTPPRQSGCVIGGALFYLGHDSGPMHLAAATGTPAVSVFSNHAKPGIWFPFGAAHRVLYPGLSWSGGEPVVRREAASEANITLIPPAQVLAACEAVLATRLASGGGPER